MPRGVDDQGSLYLSDLHLNVLYKSGGLDARVSLGYLKQTGMKCADIEWVWIVEQKRYATPQEIDRLCAGKSNPITRT